MAVTKIHPIKSTLKKALDYIENPAKTDEKMLVSSFACSYETADIEFELLLSQAMQKGNNLAHHLIQSFAPGETTPEQAHEIGRQLADEVLQGKYPYVLTTHIDKGHVHNHIIFCAVDMVNQRKYVSNRQSYIEPFTHTQTPALASRKRLLMRVLLFGKVSYYTMDTGSRIKLVREHRGLTQQKLGEMLGYGKSSANRIAQYEMGYRSPKANRLKEIAKAMNIREEIFLMPDETPIDLLRILIWYDWEHEGVLQLATSRTANTPPGKTVSPIIYSEQLPLNRLLLDWADQKHSLSVRKITRADYLEWMLQWPPRLP